MFLIDALKNATTTMHPQTTLLKRNTSISSPLNMLQAKRISGTQSGDEIKDHQNQRQLMHVTPAATSQKTTASVLLSNVLEGDDQSSR
uniref:Uncharacterized protein n=1 Tax=Syphacia muris TaxID=451379 RepID=A0A0N5ALW5_9BILA